MRRDATPANHTADGRLLLPAPRCAALRAEYRATLASAQYCSGDSDCVAQRRDGFLYDLDEGARYVKPNATGPADALAKAWAEGGCAKTHVSADEPGMARCFEGTCKRTPPATVPEYWDRHALVDIGAAWLPPRSSVTLRGSGCGSPNSIEVFTSRPDASGSDLLTAHVGFLPREPSERVASQSVVHLGSPRAAATFELNGMPARLTWNTWRLDGQNKRQYCEMELGVKRAEKIHSPALNLHRAEDGSFAMRVEGKTCDDMGYLETIARHVVLYRGSTLPW
jgi:hypothetical protein